MPNKRILVLIAGLLALVVSLSAALPSLLAQEDDEFTWAGTTPAPAFPEGLAWLNVPEPLTLEDLQGKIVLLDFWTYGCINCIHITPELKRLDEEFGDELVIIGVHTAKFEAEGVTENIRQIVQRYDKTYPVVNDVDYVFWGAYQVRAWPTLFLLDPRGNIVGVLEGEGDGAGRGVYDIFAPIVRTMIEEYGDAGLLDSTPIATTPEQPAASPLSFPGKVHVDEVGRRLFIADTGNHRIIVANLDTYEVLQVIGTGEAGMNDGALETATFDTPHGLYLAGDILYVADTNNHAIRAVDLAAGTVTRIAGTGSISPSYTEGGAALETALRSPWDVLAEGNTLYIAMAGSHQLWAMDLEAQTVAPFAGSALEDLIDGALSEAALAQPSGLALDGDRLYFADSESSSVRYVDLAAETVETAIGPVDEPRNRLFIFGDVDGTIADARLQHPLGVAVDENGLVYVADTYNNKIKVFDPATGEISTFAGEIGGGYFDGVGVEALFDEPGGIDYAEGRLYIADTNNHAVRVLDVESGAVTSVIFPNVTTLLPQDTTLTDEPLVEEPLVSQPSTVPDFTSDPNGLFGSQARVLEPQTVAPGQGVVVLNVTMPPGYKLNAQAPFTALWSQSEAVAFDEASLNYAQITPELPIQFPVTLTEGTSNISLDLTVYWCEAINETLCFVDRSLHVIPVVVSADEAAVGVIEIPYELVPPATGENSFGN